MVYLGTKGGYPLYEWAEDRARQWVEDQKRVEPLYAAGLAKP